MTFPENAKNSVAVVNIGISSLASLINGVFEVGFDPHPIIDPEKLSNFPRLIFPGNGNFSNASEILKRSGWDDAIRLFAASGKPILGICLGMQMLASTGEESGQSSGLDLIPGHVKKIQSLGLRIPHVGWNSVERSRIHKIFQKAREGCDFYFSHSYVFEPIERKNRLAKTNYGTDFCSAVGHQNVVGVQFHPEKSQKNGLSVLSEFLQWDGVAEVC